MITYGPVDGQSSRMAVYNPRTSETAAPVVVNIHGGGWISGDETSDTAFSRYLADRGFLVFSPAYALATATRPTWELTPRQIACALATANTVSPRYGGSVQRFYLTGRSAGANLATMVANRLIATPRRRLRHRPARAQGVDVSVVAMHWTGHSLELSGAAGRVIAQLTVQWFNEHTA